MICADFGPLGAISVSLASDVARYVTRPRGSANCAASRSSDSVQPCRWPRAMSGFTGTVWRTVMVVFPPSSAKVTVVTTSCLARSSMMEVKMIRSGATISRKAPRIQ